MTNKAVRSQQIRRWHRRLSLSVLLWVFFVACSGMALNHTKDLSLDQIPLPQAIIQRIYHMPPIAIRSFFSDGVWLSEVSGSQLYWNRQPLGLCQQLQGATLANNELYIACEQDMYIVNHQGELIEHMGAPQGLPTPITAFGQCQNQPCLQQDQHRYQLNPTTFLWQQTELAIKQAPATDTPSGLRQHLQALSTPPDFTAERLIRDLHSGVIFGLGPWLMDIFALVLMAVSGLGATIWWRGRRKL